MNQYDFLYAIGRLRALEGELTSTAAMEQLLAADFESAIKMLCEKGWGSEDTPYEQMLEHWLVQAWDLLHSINPYPGCLDLLVVKNDFHNLKASIKAYVAGKGDAGDSLLRPSVYPPEQVRDRVFAREFDALPLVLQAAASRCYQELAGGGDAQMADVIADSAALRCMQDMARKTGDTFLTDLAERLVAAANIKTAARAALTRRTAAFLEEAIVPCATLDKEALAAAALEGFESVREYLAGTGYREAGERLGVSLSAYEKWSDDALMAFVLPAKYVAFGVAPLAAYYVAVETEVKALRIVLSCKRNRVDEDMIRERMRLLYV